MRATLISAAAVPARAGATEPTATANSGPVATPMPRPVRHKPMMAGSTLRAPATAARTQSPQPIRATPPLVVARELNLLVRMPENGETSAKIAAIGTSASPAPTALSRPALCQLIGSRNNMPYMPNVIAAVARMAPRKGRMRNRSSGTRAASPRRRSMIQNSGSETQASAAAASASHGTSSASIAAKASPPRISAPSTCAGASKARPRGSADSGSTASAKATAAMPMGMTMTKMLRQPACSMSKPPKVGPITKASPSQADQMPMACRRSAGSGQTTATKASDAAPAHQHGDAGRDGAAERADHKHDRASNEGETPPVKVGDQPTAQQQHRIGEIVAVDGPLQRGDAGAEMLPDRRDREIDHRAVELGDQHRETQGHEPQPAPRLAGTVGLSFHAPQNRVLS